MKTLLGGGAIAIRHWQDTCAALFIRVREHNCSVARLAQLVERKALNLVVVGSSPTVGVIYQLRKTDLENVAIVLSVLACWRS